MAPDKAQQDFNALLDKCRKILQKVLEKQILSARQYRPYTLQQLLSSRGARGDLKSKKNIFKQNREQLSWNSSEQAALETGDLEKFDISLLTRLLRIQNISALNVTQRQWSEFSNTEGKDIDDLFDELFHPLKPNGAIDSRDVKLAGLISAVAYYRNESSHSTKEFTKDFLETGCAYIVITLKKIHKILDSIDWEIVKQQTDDCEHLNKDSFFKQLPDYMPISSLSVVGYTRLSSECIEIAKGERFCYTRVDKIDEVISSTNGYFTSYPSELIIVLVNTDQPCTSNISQNSIWFDDTYSAKLGSLRGKILLLCPDDCIEICNQPNIDTVKKHLKRIKDIQTDDDKPFVTISDSNSFTSEIRELMKNNYTSIGCIRIDHQMPDADSFNLEVIKLNMRWVNMRKMVIHNDDRLPVIDKLTKKEICEKLQQGRSVYEIAITKSLPTAFGIIDDELCNKGIRKLLDKFLEKEVITPSENVQIEKELQDRGKNVAVWKLLEIVHSKSESEIDAFIRTITGQNIIALAYFIDEMIERVKHVKKDQEETPPLTTDKIHQISINMDTENNCESQMREGKSIADLDPRSVLEDEEDINMIIPEWLGISGDNPQINTGCVEIKVDVSNEFEVEIIRQSIEHGIFLSRYCGWLRNRGILLKENEQITIKLSLGGEEILVHSQKTPDIPVESDDGKVLGEEIHKYEKKIEEMPAQKTNVQILKQYVRAEELAWGRFVCNAEGNADRYRDEWQKEIINVTINSKNQEVYKLIQQEVLTNGKINSFEKLFKMMGDHFLINEFQKINNTVAHSSSMDMSLSPPVPARILVSDSSRMEMSPSPPVSAKILDSSSMEMSPSPPVSAKILGDGAKPGIMRSFSQYERENQVQQQIKEAKLKGLLENMRSGLKSYYKRECGKVCYMPWDMSRHKDIGKVYVPLTLFESLEWSINYEKERKAPFQGYCDVINHYSERHRDTPVCLIVAADPGCGKSMLCKKILYDWATEPNLLDRYELVMLLEPKHFVSNFMKAVMDEIPSKYLAIDTSVNLVKKAVESSKVLCIVDGYDEVNDRDQQEDLQKLLNKGLFEKCDLIVTTRHWCVDELVKYKAFQQVLSIRRFEKEDVASYMNNFLAVEEAEALTNQISENKLENLMQEPLTCLLLCLVYKSGPNFPRLKTQLFAYLLEIFKKTYTTKTVKKHCDETKWKSLLKCLGKVAFLKLFENMGGILQFERSYLVENQVDIDLACQVGFLVKVACPISQETNVKPFPPITERNDYFRFVQPSLHLQEYFAAAYIYNSMHEIISQYKQVNPGKHEKYQSYENLLLFVCGQLHIDHNVSEEKLKLVNELLYYDYTTADHYQPYSTMYNFWRINKLWAESDYIENFKWIVIDTETISSFYKKFGNTKDMSLDQVYELYIDGKYVSDPVETAVRNFFNGKEAQCSELICFKHFCAKFTETHTLIKLAVRNIWCTCDGKSQSLWHLLAGEKSTIENRASLSTEQFSNNPTVLTHLSMYNCGITEDTIKDISPVLKRLVALEFLDLSFNNINGGLKHVLESVSKNIQKLRLSYCDITSEQAADASPFLSQLTNLNTLTLSGNPLKSGAKEITEYLCTSIQYLYLTTCNISSHIAKEIATNLTKLDSLQVLNLSYNSIREGCVDIIEHINNSVISVLMVNCDISVQHVHNITKEKLASLEYIGLYNPKLSEQENKVIEHIVSLCKVPHANITGAED